MHQDGEFFKLFSFLNPYPFLTVLLLISLN